jgi:Calcineurin-like phosphoesterase
MSDEAQSQPESAGKLVEDFLVRSRRAELRGRRKVAILLLVFVLLLLALWWINRTLENHRGLRKRDVVDATYVWVQLLPDEPKTRPARLVRAIVPPGGACPTVIEDGREINMQRREPPAGFSFPLLLCQATVAAGSDARIGGRTLPITPTEPRDILVLGDTGCRLTRGWTQACNSGVEWPFAAVAVSAAIEMNASRAPLIIHVGDFHYRESACPAGDPKCEGSPYGDYWNTWEEEFFKPARPLLLVAPWVILRGNHEDCRRAGTGWLFFFALPHEDYRGACPDAVAKYAVRIGETATHKPRVLVVLDTSAEKDTRGIAKRCATYAGWLDGIESDNAEIWLALHQPIWFRNPEPRWHESNRPQGCEDGKTSSALDQIRQLGLMRGPNGQQPVKLVVSGDVHVFQFFQPREPDEPIQIVAGTGGTDLDRLVSLPAKSDSVSVGTNGSDKSASNESSSLPAGENADSSSTTMQTDRNVISYGISGDAWTLARHGFVTLSQGAAGWTLRWRDTRGDVVLSCYLPETKDPQQPAAARQDCDEKQVPAVSAP